MIVSKPDFVSLLLLAVSVFTLFAALEKGGFLKLPMDWNTDGILNKPKPRRKKEPISWVLKNLPFPKPQKPVHDFITYAASIDLFTMIVSKPDFVSLLLLAVYIK
jgi:hypothetical protein